MEKFKQKNRDEVLDKVSRSEHGLAKFAHLNVLVAAYNELLSNFEKSVGSTDTSLLVNRNYADNAAAITAGLDSGDLYHTDGVLKIVL